MRRHRLEAALEREIAVCEPLGLVLEQALGPREPAAADRLLQPDAAVLVRELHGDDRGARVVPGRDVARVRALEDRDDLGDLVGEVRAPGEQLEILRRELVARGGRREAGRSPRASAASLMASRPAATRSRTSDTCRFSHTSTRRPLPLESSPCPRGRWIPTSVAEEGRRLSGMEYVQAIVTGELPAPPISELMGFRLVLAEPGRAVFEMEPGPQHYNPIGSVHGGIALTLLDSAMGCAVHTQLERGVGYTTLEVKTNFVRPITADTGVIRCEGIVIHQGSRIATAEGKLTDPNGKLLAHGTTTCLIFQ